MNKLECPPQKNDVGVNMERWCRKVNNKISDLIYAVCDGDILKAQSYARVLLNGITAKADENFKNNQLRKLDTKQAKMVELPANLQGLLSAENVTEFPMGRFYLRETDERELLKVIGTWKVAKTLSELGLDYSPTLLLHGESGCGKTMLARYMAHLAELPFVYVKMSGVLDSHLGKSQSNIARICEYAKAAPCVLCFDEIDAIGMARGQKGDVGEMNRIVIALMQELDSLPNNVIVVAATNRYDMLDPALSRRFRVHHKVLPLNVSEVVKVCEMFSDYTGCEFGPSIEQWCKDTFGMEGDIPASVVINICTEKVVADAIAQREARL